MPGGARTCYTESPNWSLWLDVMQPCNARSWQPSLDCCSILTDPGLKTQSLCPVSKVQNLSNNAENLGSPTHFRDPAHIEKSVYYITPAKALNPKPL